MCTERPACPCSVSPQQTILCAALTRQYDFPEVASLMAGEPNAAASYAVTFSAVPVSPPPLYFCPVQRTSPLASSAQVLKEVPTIWTAVSKWSATTNSGG